MGAPGSSPATVEGILNSLHAKGRPPDEREFLELIKKQPGLTPENRYDAWRCWAKGQRPAISTADLHDIVLAKRESIYDVRLKYSVENFSRSAEEGMVKVSTGEHEFASSGEKLLYRSRITYLRPIPIRLPRSPAKGRSSSKRPPATRTPANTHTVLSNDGKVGRTFMLDRTGMKIGTIEPPLSRGSFFKANLPLTTAMLIDAERDAGSANATSDLVHFLGRKRFAYVMEKPAKIDGRETLVAFYGAVPSWKAYLDPARNYSVVRFESLRNTRGECREVLSIWLKSGRSFEQLEDAGDGIWLARKVVRTWYAPPSSGKDTAPVPTQRTIITVQEMAVNKGCGSRCT